MTESNYPSSLVTLWYKPGQTLQGLIADGKGVNASIWTAVCFGLVHVWPSYAAGESPQPGLLLAGGALGLAGLFLFSWLLRNFSRWFGAEAKLSEVRTALGWGLLPWTVLLGLLLVIITLQGGDASPLFPVFFAALVYGFVILLSALSVALRLSLMKTFFCLIVTFLVSIFPITLVIQLLTGVPGPAG
ncbi:MAG: YIP1 family protein [Opitutales bacterium]